ncbi:hypothetical protein INT46_007071 [Mucor plumbeus]|uniref:Uncharacterized protein n=1 Tax=Mucor plumbeus TaxID=97098 RepID=A0A8H7RRV3_9FUNG|nr:hypothetical protein INT46_007071 [Mucor plumbeus]
MSVAAVIGCAAEANFQACKSIEESLLHGCGPVDYACQCGAQKLIRQCFDLCPEYSIDANEQARVATGICAAVPTPSIVPLPSGSLAPSQASATWVASATTGSTVAPSASQSAKSSFGVHVVPFGRFIAIITIMVIALTLYL